MRTEAGRVVSAHVVVCAIPVNCWGDIEIKPGLSEPKRSAIGHAGTPAGRYWVLVEGAPEGAFFVADPPNCRGAYQSSVYTRVGDAQLFAGFTPGMNISSPEGVAAAVEMFTPGARIVAGEGYDWTADRFAKGAWAGFEPGYLSRSHSKLAAPEGRLSSRIRMSPTHSPAG